MSDKYKILKEVINEWIEREHENLHDAVKSAGSNSVGAAMCMGALEAYKQVLSDIEELEMVAVTE